MATDISAPDSIVLPTVPVSTYTTPMSASINDLVMADKGQVAVRGLRPALSAHGAEVPGRLAADFRVQRPLC
jgi:hypothetical protein